MRARWIALGLATVIGCGSSEGESEGGSEGGDAGVDAGKVAEGGLDANMPDAADASSKICKTGLAETSTEGVVCGSTTCGKGKSCCIGAASHCEDSCPNLELDWVCDTSAHCGSGKTCCFDAPLLEFGNCPGTAINIAPVCKADGSCKNVACQTDADCPGKTCYAITVGTSPARTLGVCH